MKSIVSLPYCLAAFGIAAMLQAPVHAQKSDAAPTAKAPATQEAALGAPRAPGAGGQIHVESFSWGASNAGNHSGAAPSEPGNLAAEQKLPQSKSSSLLHLHLSNGQHIKQ